jgi:hypothetical protein
LHPPLHPYHHPASTTAPTPYHHPALLLRTTAKLTMIFNPSCLLPALLSIQAT